MSDAAAPSPPPPGGPLGQLLVVQSEDTAADLLRHRARTLPERAALEAAGARVAEIARAVGQARPERDRLSADQSDLEAQIEAARTRSEQIDKRMRSGQVTAGRDLTAMDDEVRHLADHVRALEDRELQIMEELEPLERQLADAETEVDQLQDQVEHLRGALVDAEMAIEAEIAAVTSRRAEAAAAVPEALLTQYERIRARADGVGIARLVGSTCGGCHLALPSMEVDRIRKVAADTVVTCDQCGRILVR